MRHEPDQRREEEAVAGAEPQQRLRVGRSADIFGGITSPSTSSPPGFEQPAEQREQRVELLGGEILRDRMHDDDDRSSDRPSCAMSSGARTSILALPAKRAASSARTLGAGSHRIRRCAAAATRSACSASPQP